MAFFSIKHEEKKIKALLVTTILANEILEIVFAEHLDIVSKAIIQTVDKNPELFKDALEEVKKKHDATIQQEDNSVNGVSRLQRID